MIILYHAIEVDNIVGLNKTCYAGLSNPEMQPVSRSTLFARTCTVLAGSRAVTYMYVV